MNTRNVAGVSGEALVKLFDKVLSVLVDRRFWLEWVFPVVFAFKIFPYITLENQEQMATDAIAWVELLAKVLTPIVSSLVLGSSWTKRPPSGLNWKNIKSEVDEFVGQIKDLVK